MEEIKEYKSKKEALEENEAFEVKDYRVNKDYAGLVLGNYTVLSYVSIFKLEYSRPMVGWLCKNNENGFFRVFTNFTISTMYQKAYADTDYFGLNYVNSDIPYKRLNIKDFKKEFVEEANKIDPLGLEHLQKQKEEYINNPDKWVNNVQKNIDYFKSLNKQKYEEELNRLCTKYHFHEIKDMGNVKKCLYIAALDQYNQFYVGKCVGYLKNRMKKHWTAKSIPSRHLWNGSFEYSRIKYDDFKMYDTTRIFVCDKISLIINENLEEALDKAIEITNTFGFGTEYEKMTELDKAERIVINNSKCMFTLSDRTMLTSAEFYQKLSEQFKLPIDDLLVKHYNNDVIEKLARNRKPFKKQ